MVDRGLFISCEGGEGTGKTTLINRLEQVLLSRGYHVMKTREPGGSRLGDEIRKLLLHRDLSIPISHQTELLLFLAARAQNLEETIRPALKEGKIVLCDRFNDSTVAYQGYARGLGVDAVQHLCDQVCAGTVPDLTYFLDVDPQEGLMRTKRSSKDSAGAGQVDRIEAEKLEFHQRVRAGLQELSKRYPERIFRLNAHEPLEAVFAAALARLEPLLAEVS